MSYRYRKCRICNGSMDPEEGSGNICDECIQKESEELGRRKAFKNLFDPGTQIQFQQMRMEDIFL